MKKARTDPQGKRCGAILIRRIGNLFKFRKDMTEHAIDLYNRVYHEKILHCSMDSKKVLAVTCIYVTARENDYGITVKNLARFLDDINKGVHKFGRMLKLLHSEYNISVKDIGPGLEAYTLLSSVNFPPHLIKKTQTLLQLLQMSWIITGRSRMNIIIASAYTVWKSDDLLNNKRVGLETFCKKFKLYYGRSVSSRKAEIYEVLKAMALQIPWVKCNKDSEVNVEHHLNDILTFQHTLLQNAIAAAELECREAETVNDEHDSKEIVERNAQHVSKEIVERNAQHDSKEIVERNAQHDSKEIVERNALHDSKEIVHRNAQHDSKEIVEKNAQHVSEELEIKIAHHVQLFKRKKQKKKYSNMKTSKLSSPRMKDIGSSDDENGTFDLGSEDDTDLYILEPHEVELKQYKAKLIEELDKEKDK